MKRTLLIALAIAFSGLTNAETPRFDSTKLFVKVKAGQELPTSAHILSAKHLFGGNYLVSTDNAVQLENELKGNNSIAKTERNYYAGKQVLPKIEKTKNDGPLYNFAAFNDPKVGKIWSFLDAADNGISINKSYLSPLGMKKEEIIVAVVDTGVDYNHEDLRDVMWVNVNEVPGNGIDDDNNGYIDDVHGINTLVRDANGNATGDPMASHSHGTHVSGTIGAKQNNNIGIAGIASTVKIMAIRTVPDNADETDADVVESYLYAAKNGAKLINCSFGKTHNEGGMIVNDTIDHIGKTYGTLVLAAAGNDYQEDIDAIPHYPASFPSDHLMVVASTAKGGGLSFFSNIGAKSVDIAAPGSNIYSTIPGNSYGNMSGTSMATPTTVGVAAELLSHFPDLDGVSIKEALMASVVKVSKFKGKMVSGGRVDLHNALKYTLDNYSDILYRQTERTQE